MVKKGRLKTVSNRSMRYYYLLALLPFLFLVVMYELLPLIMLIIDSFQLDKDPSVAFTLDNYIKIIMRMLTQMKMVLLKLFL